jgi:hypothetical protein
MKVYLNKYRNHWLSPYTILEKFYFWRKDYDVYDHEPPKWLTKVSLLIQTVFDIVHPKIDYVKIDYWDTWSMDTTLALIILPMLKQLQATKHGAPNVDDEDVPEELKSTSAEAKENDWDVDSNHFKRWDWVIEEMIFAFDSKVNDDWEDQFWKVKPELDLDKYPEDEGKTLIPLRWKVEGKCDQEGRRAYQEKIQNGFRLFGKYYQSLWD